MSSRSDNAPMPVQPPPDAVDAELSPLMSEPFADAYARAHDGSVAGAAVRGRLLQRLEDSYARVASWRSASR